MLISEGTFTSSAIYINLEYRKPPYSISIYPGSGCSCVVKTCNKKNAAATVPASSYWEEWDQGEVSSATTSYINAPISAIEITRVSGSTTCEYVVQDS